MTTRNLQYLFAPRSIAIIGASARPGSVGAAVTRNLLSGGFAGALRLVNPKHERVGDHACYRSVGSLDIDPELAVICTPPGAVPGLVAELGARGTRAAIVLTAGLDGATGKSGLTLSQAMLDAAKPHLLRILGANCVGLLSPHLGINASFAHEQALPGNLAFISQSGALTTALLDWARARQVGFSHFVSLGASDDVDFGDVLDYLADDPQTEAILLYVEAIKHARKFMSAARRAARNKPVIVVKAGRAPEGAKAATTHTGALAGADAVYDAALRRAGALRVLTTDELFIAAETLSFAKPLQGERLAILTNGGGPGVLAADAVCLGGAQLARLSAATIVRLNSALPGTWSHANPVDIIGDAPVARYADAIRILAADMNTDALLFIHAPTAIVDSMSIALTCAPLLRDCRVPVFSCWLGGHAVAPARQVFVESGLPTYDTPEDATTAFLQAVQYRRNQEILFETPPASAESLLTDMPAARAVVEKALLDRRSMLSEPEAKAVLRAYGIPTVETRIARDIGEAADAAVQLGYPVVLKILSPDIPHKSDVDGVALDIRTAEMLVDAASGMLARVKDMRPGAAVQGFSVQTMVRRPHAFELIVGATTDAVFGPVVAFGQGGTGAERIADTAIALPPLNAYLARDLISRTRIAKQLSGYRNRPGVDMKAIESVLLQVAHILADIPEITELDINPLLADEKGVIALDARARIAIAAVKGTGRFAIVPYPAQLEENVEIGGKAVVVRPIRPEDEVEFKLFVSGSRVAIETYVRHFHLTSEWTHAQLARFTQIDYDREMALVAIHQGEILAEVRVMSGPDNLRSDFSVLVRPDWAETPLARILLERIFNYCRKRGIGQLFGDIGAEDRHMLDVMAALGFQRCPEAGQAVRMSLKLAH